jgi:hypothetical protein
VKSKRSTPSLPGILLIGPQRNIFDIDPPEEDTAYYRTVHDATYPEAQAMIELEDGYFEDTWWNDTYGSTQYDRLKNAPIITTEDVNGKRAGNLQSDKRHEPVMPSKHHMVTDAPLLRQPHVNVHASRKHLKTRPRLESPSTKKQQQKKNKATQLNHTNWQTQEQQIVMRWTHRHLAAFLAIPEMALEWNVEPG